MNNCYIHIISKIHMKILHSYRFRPITDIPEIFNKTASTCDVLVKYSYQIYSGDLGMNDYRVVGLYMLGIHAPLRITPTCTDFNIIMYLLILLL